MSREFVVTAANLPAMLHQHLQQRHEATVLALQDAADRGRALMVDLYNEKAAEQGVLRDGWQVIKEDDGAILKNDVPYAGIIEEGSRPHRMDWDGVQAIFGWVGRKKGFPTDLYNLKNKEDRQEIAKIPELRDLLSMTFAICNKIAKEGTPPRHLLANAQPELVAIVEQELARLEGLPK